MDKKCMLKGQMPHPINLDFESQPWNLTKEIIPPVNSIISINLLHTSPSRCTKALFSEAIENPLRQLITLH